MEEQVVLRLLITEEPSVVFVHSSAEAEYWEMVVGYDEKRGGQKSFTFTVLQHVSEQPVPFIRYLVVSITFVTSW